MRASIIGAAICVVAGAGLGAAFFAAGPLNPPAGAVASTYKTLTEVEPRIAIGAATTPGDALARYVITQPGSYYFMGNVVTTGGKAALRIEADNVSVDIMGFTLDGSTDASPTANGIQTNSHRRNITIRNGTVSGFRSYGITGPMSLCHFEDLLVSSNRLGQLEVFNADDSIARNVRIFATAGEAGLTLGQNATIEGCVMDGGFLGIAVLSGTISRCTVNNVSGVGLRCSQAGVISGCVVSGMTSGSSFNNGGIVAGTGTRVERCTLRNCVAAGVFLAGSCEVVDCQFWGCDRGVAASAFQTSRGRIEGNTFQLCATGVMLDTARHIVIGNRFTGNTANITAVAGSTVGEVLNFSAGGTMTAVNSHGAANIVY